MNNSSSVNLSQSIVSSKSNNACTKVAIDSFKRPSYKLLKVAQVIKLIFGKVTGCLNREDARLHLCSNIVRAVAEKLSVV